MSRSFDYQSATLAQVAGRFKDITNQAYSRLLSYYTNKNDLPMIAKLEQGRKLSKIMRLQDEYESTYG